LLITDQHPILAILQALYDYFAKSTSELSFQRGDTMVVLSKDNPDWWKVQKKEYIGLVPSSYGTVSPLIFIFFSFLFFTTTIFVFRSPFQSVREVTNENTPFDGFLKRAGTKRFREFYLSLLLVFFKHLSGSLRLTR